MITYHFYFTLSYYINIVKSIIYLLYIYVTHSLPRHQVIGVVQMINKMNDVGVFNEADEETFKMFAVYCAQSLRYAQVPVTVR